MRRLQACTLLPFIYDHANRRTGQPAAMVEEGPWRLAWAVGLRLNRVIQEDRTLDFLHDHNSMRIQKALQPDWTVESAAAALSKPTFTICGTISLACLTIPAIPL